MPPGHIYTGLSTEIIGSPGFNNNNINNSNENVANGTKNKIKDRAQCVIIIATRTRVHDAIP